MEHLVNVLKVRQDFFQIQQLNRNDFKLGIVCMVGEVFAAPGRKIVQDPDLRDGNVSQQSINQMGTDKTGTAGDQASA
jgi:hypothetical protein